MKIVIDIPEWQYKSICEGIEASKRCSVVGIDPDIHEAIYNGTPLPKGHGRLKDVDWIDDNCENHFSYQDGSWCYTWRDMESYYCGKNARELRNE